MIEKWTRGNRPFHCDFCNEYVVFPCTNFQESEECSEMVNQQINTEHINDIVEEPLTNYLYVIPRSHLSSMTPGKAMAHVGHACNAFIHENMKSEYGLNSVASLSKWENSTSQGFGTTIVLQGTDKNAKAFVSWCQKPHLSHYGSANAVIDPNYPYQVTDEIYHLIPERIHTEPAIYNSKKKLWTCFRSETTAYYVFCDKNHHEAKEHLKRFRLHP